jgi:hypothetical protein
MNRREFVQTSALGITVLLANGCSSHAGDAEMELELAPGPAAEDIRWRVLRYAVRAPNSHNTQPWLVDLRREGELDLYVDRSRLLPQTDPPARQIHISQGTFLELLTLAAAAFGYGAEVKYFPRGQYSSPEVADLPVATVVFHPDATAPRDPLFGEIPKRYTNKRNYDPTVPLTAAQVAAIQAAPGSQRFPLLMISEAQPRQTLTQICHEAMQIETSGAARNRETGQWFRFSDQEARQKRDGFSVAHNGTTGIRKWVAETFLLSRKSVDDPKGMFARLAADAVREQAHSAPAFAALVSTANTRLDQVLVGRAYARIQLAGIQAGLFMHPFSQVLEEYPEMAELQGRFKQALGVAPEHTVQMFFRIGQAQPSPHTLRRDVHSLVRSA